MPVAHNNRRCWSSALLLLVGMLLMPAAGASATETSDVHKTPRVTITLLPAVHLADHESLWSGVAFDMAPDWKIYWRNPGAGGRPPALHWQTRSQNIAAAELHWPFPERFRFEGLWANGYSGRVILPLRLERTKPAEDGRLDVQLDYYICKELCFAAEARLVRSVPAGKPRPQADPLLSERLAASLDRVPRQDSPFLNVTPPEVLVGGAGWSRLHWRLTSTRALAELDAFVDQPPILEERHPPLQIFDADRRSLDIRTEVTALKTTEPLALVLRAKTTDGDVFYSRHPFSSVETSAIDWGWVVLIALVGGLLINIMPCVLPVLMLKLFGLLKHPDQAAPGHFLATSAGILTAFGGLGTALALVRFGGERLYWGAQFQNPVFLVVMLGVLIAFAAQMLGWWTLRLPGFLPGAQGSRTQSLAGAFSSGVIATVLATPCSAPLIGVTISLALFVPNGAMVLILLVMGLGMASPYLLLAVAPGLRRFLPKPGAWMDKVRILLAVSILATAVWVLWLLQSQIGGVGVGTMLALAMLMLGAFALVRLPDLKLTPHRFKLAAVLLLLMLALPGRFADQTRAITPEDGWSDFAPGQIAGALAGGKTVLVDVTADWCLNCLVNDRLVYDRAEILAWRRRPDVVAMRGDWSLPDSEIAGFLARFQRNALPFGVLFTPTVPEGKLLPELMRLSDFERILADADAAGYGRF